MPNTIALRFVAILVLLPSTLVAAFWSLMGIPFAEDALQRRGHAVAGTVLFAALAAGWFGLVTLWRLYYHLLHERTDFNRNIAWAGLAVGCLVSLALIATTGGTLTFRVVFFGWPLLTAAFFAIVLWRIPVQTGYSPPRMR